MVDDDMFWSLSVVVGLVSWLQAAGRLLDGVPPGMTTRERELGVLGVVAVQRQLVEFFVGRAGGHDSRDLWAGSVATGWAVGEGDRRVAGEVLRALDRWVHVAGARAGHERARMVGVGDVLLTDGDLARYREWLWGLWGRFVAHVNGTVPGVRLRVDPPAVVGWAGASEPPGEAEVGDGGGGCQGEGDP